MIGLPILIFLTVLIISSTASATGDEPLYYSESNSLQDIIDTDFPNSEDKIVFNWQYSPINTKSSNSSTMWTITSTPLIVGDYVYIACGDLIYKLEASTGACVKKVGREYVGASFYHYLGYGDGTIIDYNGGQLFDLNLNEKGRIASIKASWYLGDKFYGIFSTNNNSYVLKSFTIDKQNNIFSARFTELIVDVSDWYGVYGQKSTPILDGNVLYYIGVTSTQINSGEEIPYKILINSVNVASGSKKTLDLDLDYRYLDDGWLTLYDGRIFLPTYSSGLFENNDNGKSAVTCISLNDGEMTKAYTKYFDESGTTSNFIVFNGRGYINVNLSNKEGTSAGYHAKFYVFDMANFNENSDPLFKIDSCYTHGGIVLNKHYYESNGSIYIYIVPYDDSASPGKPYLYVIEDKSDGDVPTLSNYVVAKTGNSGGNGFSSQAIRAGPNGELIWYKDNGQVVCFTSVEKKSYYILLENDDKAVWIQLTDKELVNNGNDNIIISNKNIINFKINNEIVKDFDLYYYKDGTGWKKASNHNLNETTVGAYSEINTSKGCSINYLILTNSKKNPKIDEIYATDSNTTYQLGGLLLDKSLVGVPLSKIIHKSGVYDVSLDVSATNKDTILDVKIQKNEDSPILEEGMLLVIVMYDSVTPINLYLPLHIFENEITERVVVGSTNLKSVTVDVVDGIQNKPYINYGTATFIPGQDVLEPEPEFVPDYSIEWNDGIKREFQSGHTYKIDLFTSVKINAIGQIVILDGNGTEMSTYTVSVTDTKYNILGEDKKYHNHFNLTITGASLDGSLYMRDGGWMIPIQIIGQDVPEPEPEFVPDFTFLTGLSNSEEEPMMEAVSGQPYKIDLMTEAAITELGQLCAYDSASKPMNNYAITVSDIVYATSPGSDGRFHNHLVFTITGVSSKETFVPVYGSGEDYTFYALVKVIGSEPEMGET